MQESWGAIMRKICLSLFICLLLVTATFAIEGKPPVPELPLGELTRQDGVNLFYEIMVEQPGKTPGNPLETLIDLGVISGYPDGSFRMNAPLTRAEFFKMLWIGLGKVDYVEQNEPPMEYKDLTAEDGYHWAAGYFNLLKQRKWISASPLYDFLPETVMTGREAQSILKRTEKFAYEPDMGVSGFYINQPYECAPKMMRDLMEYDGVVGEVEGFCDIVQYQYNGLTVHVGHHDLDNQTQMYRGLEGIILSVYFTGDTYATPRNLKCGDSLRTYWDLYNYNCYGGPDTIGVKHEDGILTAIGFSNRYDSTFPLEMIYTPDGHLR